MHITKKQIIIIAVIVIIIGLSLGLGLGLGLKSNNKNNNSIPIIDLSALPILNPSKSSTLNTPQSSQWTQDACNSYMNTCAVQNQYNYQAMQNCAIIAKEHGC